MKDWIIRIVGVCLGVGGTAGVNFYMNQPQAEIGKGAEKLVASMATTEDWLRETNYKGDEVFFLRKDKLVKVKPGYLWAEVFTRKKPPAALTTEKWLYESETTNPWLKCNTLNGRETALINKACEALRANMEKVELDQ